MVPITQNNKPGDVGTGVRLGSHTHNVSVQSNAYTEGMVKVDNKGVNNPIGVASA